MRSARPARGAALALAAALGAVTLLRLPAAWASGNALNHVSGVWLALADDLARGTFYRPLHPEPFTYGGTRYFPLVFTLEALLAHAGAPPAAAGEAVSLAAGLLLAAGVARLLSALGARRGEALAGAALAFAGAAGQRALADARGDLLPVALSALALATLARPPAREAGAPALPAALLVLAFAAKPTALSAAAAAVVALTLEGRRRDAARLALLVAAGAGGVVLVTQVLSGGRFLTVLRATARAGATLRTAAAAPVRLATEAALGDPGGLALALAAALALLAAAPALLRSTRRDHAGAADPRLLPALWLAAAWAAALAVYASPGTGVNHLVEVEAASAAFLAASAIHASPRERAAARLACAGLAAAGLAVALGAWHTDRTRSRGADLQALVAALPPGPLLSEDPLVALTAGARPLVLDPFALRVVSAAEPDLVGPLAAALRRGALAAVVLLEDADGPGAGVWYGRGNLGLPLVAEIRRGYEPAGTFGPYHLYLPRRRPDRARGAEAGMVRRDDAR